MMLRLHTPQAPIPPGMRRWDLIFVFFMLGLLADFTEVAEQYYMREKGLGVDGITLMFDALYVPWLLKPLYGLWSDRIPGQEATALFFIFIVSTFMCVALANTVETPALNLTILAAGETAPAAGLALAHAAMVRYSRKSGDWAAPQQCLTALAVGKCVAAYSGTVVYEYGYEAVYYAQAALSLAFCLGLFVMLGVGDGEGDIPCLVEAGEGEAPRSSQPTQAERDGQMALAIILTCLALCPTTEKATNMFWSGPMDFSPKLLGVMGGIEVLAVFGSYATFPKWTTSQLSHACIAGMMIANLTVAWVLARQEYLSDGMLLVGAAGVAAVAKSVMHTRFSIETSRIVPEDSEGFYYSLYTDIPNMGKLVSLAASAGITDYYGITHDNFERILAFHCSVTAMHASILFLPPHAYRRLIAPYPPPIPTPQT